MISHEHKFLFIHIPRTGGTSIESQFNCKENKEKNKHWTLSYWRKTLDRETFDDYFKFAFVRNPWDLMISKYKCSCLRRLIPPPAGELEDQLEKKQENLLSTFLIITKHQRMNPEKLFMIILIQSK